MKDTQTIYKLNLSREIDFFIPKEELFLLFYFFQYYRKSSR